MYELRFGSADYARVRFAESPLWEVVQAVRALIDPRQQRYHLPWLDSVRPALADLGLGPLLAIQPLRGYSPDLIAPIPRHPHTTVQEQLAQVRATPLAQVRREVRRALTDRNGQPVPEDLEWMARDPRRARAAIADSLEACWDRLVAPYWTRIHDLLSADVVHHSRLLAQGGLERLFPALSPALTWRSPVLQVHTTMQPLRRKRMAGRGLLLQPSAFAWPAVIVIWDDVYQPTLAYPARGIAELWQPVATTAAAALTTLLGRTRATLLASLHEPAATTTLARRHGIAAATVSAHLAALAGAGLVSAARHGRWVLYTTTSLGEALLAGPIGK